MEPWYKVVTPRQEVREGRSFHPDEFAIALEQVVTGTAPEDYRDPVQFFSRTCWTRALREHAGMVLRRLAGRTDNTAPVLTLITQFGGGKTHTLTALYHLVRGGAQASTYAGVPELLREANLASVPQAQVAVFVGNAWDPQEGRETPWIDMARQLAGERGVAALGNAAKTTAPGTEAITRLFQAANGPVLLLFDEVLNFVNRHRAMADSFHAFIQNLTVATAGTSHAVAVVSLPRSQVEMTDSDIQWQEKITKVVRRVAKDLIVNDEAEISEVVRRRLFEDLGEERVRRSVAKAFGEWCFQRRAQLPPQWTAVDTATTEAKAREFLIQRFAACYPFHPATLSVFQRKWQALPQYQQTRGTLAMLAQWVAWAYGVGFTSARREPLIMLGSAPLQDLGFRSTILGQLGESRLVAAIEADIAGDHSHAKALDADTKGPLREIHRRVGTAILFESSGGQAEKVAHLPELRFALGEPDLDTTSIDSAALALEQKAYFIRRVGSDGFKISYQATLKKVVSDRRASLDEEGEIKPTLRTIVANEFRRGASVPVVPFPTDSGDIPDTPRLTLVILEPEMEWVSDGTVRAKIAEWTKNCGKAPRLYPGALVWCAKKPGRDLREKVELWLAWERVSQELRAGTLGADVGRQEQNEVETKLWEAQEAAKEEVWSTYRYVVLFDPSQQDSLRDIDLGAGHSSSGTTLCGRVMEALKREALLNETVAAGYIERHWPPAFKESGAWPLSTLRQSFLNGSLTRLVDPDKALREKIVDFVAKGEFGLASGEKPDGSFERVWFEEPVSRDEVTFEAGLFLLTKAKAKALKAASHLDPTVVNPPPVAATPPPSVIPPQPDLPSAEGPKTVRLHGSVPPELWNRLGTKIIPKVKAKGEVEIRLELIATVPAESVAALKEELHEILQELVLTEKMHVL